MRRPSTPARGRALTASAATGGVITWAGAARAGAFGMLGALPLVTETGIAVALGVLVDTIVVRSAMVTARTMDLSRRMWWPTRLPLAARHG